MTGVITRNYTVVNEDYDAYEITVFLKDPTAAPNNWPRVTYYCWDSNGQQLCGGWPGEVITDTRVVHGETFYYKTFTITSSQYNVNFVFSQGGSNASSYQTVDVTGVRQTSFFEVTTQTNKFQVANVTAQYLPYLDHDVEPGDVNGNFLIDMDDLSTLINYLLTGDASLIDPVGANVNETGGIDMDDLSALINYLLTH